MSICSRSLDESSAVIYILFILNGPKSFMRSETKLHFSGTGSDVLSLKTASYTGGAYGFARAT